MHSEATPETLRKQYEQDVLSSQTEVKAKDFINSVHHFLSGLGERLKSTCNIAISKIEDTLKQLAPLAQDEEAFIKAVHSGKPVDKQLLKDYHIDIPSIAFTPLEDIPANSYVVRREKFTAEQLQNDPDIQKKSDEAFNVIVDSATLLYPNFNKHTDVIELKSNDGEKRMALLGIEDKEALKSFCVLRIKELTKMHVTEIQKAKIPQEQQSHMERTAKKPRGAVPAL